MWLSGFIIFMTIMFVLLCMFDKDGRHVCNAEYKSSYCSEEATLKYTSPNKQYTCYMCDDCAHELIRSCRFIEHLLGEFEDLSDGNIYKVKIRE